MRISSVHAGRQGFGKQDSEVTLPADRFIYKWKYIASGGLDFELDQRLERNEK